jgi:predicted ribosomally synthesized peptide with nif11-like leader
MRALYLGYSLFFGGQAQQPETPLTGRDAMSAEAVSRFWQKFDSDAEFQKKLFAKGQLTPIELAAYAGELGYEFTADELKSTADESSRELSDTELEAVAGGVLSGPSLGTSRVFQSQISRLPNLGAVVAC